MTWGSAELLANPPRQGSGACLGTGGVPSGSQQSSQAPSESVEMLQPSLPLWEGTKLDAIDTGSS